MGSLLEINLKELCHEFFYSIISWLEPVWAPDKQANILPNLVWFRRDIPSWNSKILTPRSQAHRGVMHTAELKFLGLVDPHFLSVLKCIAEVKC